MTSKHIADLLLEKADFENISDFNNWNISNCSAEIVLGSSSYLIEYSLVGFCQVKADLSVYKYSIVDNKYLPNRIEQDIKDNIESSFTNNLINLYHNLVEEQNEEKMYYERRERDYQEMQRTYESLITY